MEAPSGADGGKHQCPFVPPPQIPTLEKTKGPGARAPLPPSPLAVAFQVPWQQRLPPGEPVLFVCLEIHCLSRRRGLTDTA